MLLQLKICVLIALCFLNTSQCMVLGRRDDDNKMKLNVSSEQNHVRDNTMTQIPMTGKATRTTEEAKNIAEHGIMIPLVTATRDVARKTKKLKSAKKTKKSTKSSKSSKSSKVSKKNPSLNDQIGAQPTRSGVYFSEFHGKVHSSNQRHAPTPMRRPNLPDVYFDEFDEGDRVIGGEDVVAGEYPWFARTTTGSGQRPSWYGCGGSLISPEYVLTAAHCVSNSMDGFQIGALCRPYTQGGNCGQDVEYFDILKTVSHPEYNSRTEDNDFALSRLSGSSKIVPVNIDDGTLSKKYQNGKKVWTMGIGNTAYPNNSYPSRLKHVEVSYVTNESCCANNPYRYDCRHLTSNMMCAADLGEDACQGESIRYCN